VVTISSFFLRRVLHPGLFRREGGPAGSAGSVL
jgi:hypothetical protein